MPGALYQGQQNAKIKQALGQGNKEKIRQSYQSEKGGCESHEIIFGKIILIPEL